jgi:hypothetical protein
MSRTLIRDMLPIMNPDDDYLTIVAAEEKIASSEAMRKKELEEVHANLKCSCLAHPQSNQLLLTKPNL